MGEIEELTKKIVKFRDDRDWKQFHNPKNLAMKISVEAAELLELFLWEKESRIEQVVKDKRERIENELADVLITSFLFTNDLDIEDIDIGEIIEKKLALNEKKYPIEKFKGRSEKYNEIGD